MCLLGAPREKRGELRAGLETRVASAESLKWSAFGNPAICRRRPCCPWYMHVFILLLDFFPSLHLGILCMWCWLSNLCAAIWYGIWYIWCWCAHWFGSCQRGCSNFMADLLKCILINDRIGFGLKTIWPWNLRTSGVFLIRIKVVGPERVLCSCA